MLGVVLVKPEYMGPKEMPALGIGAAGKVLGERIHLELGENLLVPRQEPEGGAIHTVVTHAAHLAHGAVDLDEVLGACGEVEAIDVLGDDGRDLAPLDQGRRRNG